MGRRIDFSEPLNAEDARYVRDRPWMLSDAERQGLEVTFEEPEEDDGEEVDYNDLTIPNLKAEIDARNEDRDEDHKLIVKGDFVKDDYVKVLTDDDASDE